MVQHVIPYARHLRLFAHDLRLRVPRAQVLLWRELKGRKLFGRAFERQHPIDRYVVDFYCESLALAIEIDAVMQGDTRALRYDERRQVRLASLGVTVLRFTDEEVVHNLDGVVSALRRWIRRRMMK